MHSGWAVVVAVAEPVSAPGVVGRRRIELVDGSTGCAAQPYHAAERMEFADAEQYLDRCVAAAGVMARKAVGGLLAELTDYEIKGASVLLASGRPLPALANILASHALIHTAEGEFYRSALRDACASSGVAEHGIRERDVMAEAERVLGRSKGHLDAALAGFGKVIGPPWRLDEKVSTAAAWIALATF